MGGGKSRALSQPRRVVLWVSPGSSAVPSLGFTIRDFWGDSANVWMVNQPKPRDRIRVQRKSRTGCAAWRVNMRCTPGQQGGLRAGGCGWTEGLRPTAVHHEHINMVLMGWRALFGNTTGRQTFPWRERTVCFCLQAPLGLLIIQFPPRFCTLAGHTNTRLALHRG